MTGPSSNRESNPQILLVSAGSPLSSPFTISRGYWGPIRYQGAPSGAPTPDPHGSYLRKHLLDVVSNCMRGTTVQQRELLEAVHSILHFRHYLEGRHFQLYTDHAALIPLLTKKDNQHRWACWALDIQQFSFTTHVAGKSILMNGPDTLLSRHHYPDQPGLTNPPPTAPKIKVSKQIQINKTANVQYFDDYNIPVQIVRNETKLKPILKGPTHYHCCDETYKDAGGKNLHTRPD